MIYLLSTPSPTPYFPIFFYGTFHRQPADEAGHHPRTRLSLQAQVLDGSFIGIEDHVLIFVDDLNSKRDLLLTDSLDELVSETGRELEAIQRQLIQNGKPTG